MKRFTIYGFVFVLVCGQYINGVQSEISDASGVNSNPKCLQPWLGNKCVQCQDGYVLDANKQCQSPNHNDTFPIVKAVPGHDACGAINKTLKVNGFIYGLTAPSSTYCQHICQSRADCTHFVYDYNNIMRLDCWIVTRLNFGIKKKNVVTGPPVCPSKDDCFNPNVKYDGDGATSLTFLNISSPQACQKNCSNGISVAFTYDTKAKICYCKDINNFRIVSDANYVSGDVVCPDCFKHHHDLSLLPNIDNGGPYPYLTVNSAVECQKHCKNNSLCTLFEFDPSKNQCRLKNEGTVEIDEDSVAYISRKCDISCTCNKDGLKPGIYGDCNPLGDCICNEQEGYTGKHCSTCKDGYRKEGTICKRCGCNDDGATNKTCTSDGSCFCKPEYKKPKCIGCADEAYRDVKDKTCQMCNCDVDGATNQTCATDGACFCKPLYKKPKCNECVDGYYRKVNDKTCQMCNCDVDGSTNQTCTTDGSCFCKPEYKKPKCIDCADGYRKVNNTCQPCNCNATGSITPPKCDVNGTCTCKHMYGGDKCDSLIVRTYKYSHLRYYDSYIYKIDCYGKCSWQILEVSFSSWGNMDIYGATGAFYSNHFVAHNYGTLFCKGVGSNNPENCTKLSAASNSPIYIWLFAKSGSSNVEFKYQVSNAKSVHVTKTYPPDCGGC